VSCIENCLSYFNMTGLLFLQFCSMPVFETHSCRAALRLYTVRLGIQGQIQGLRGTTLGALTQVGEEIKSTGAHFGRWHRLHTNTNCMTHQLKMHCITFLYVCRNVIQVSWRQKRQNTMQISLKVKIDWSTPCPIRFSGCRNCIKRGKEKVILRSKI
jgi:hypothetical protein